MSAIKRFMKDSMERLKVDELLRKELRNSGYGGITMTKTPMGTQITLYTMWPGRVIGKRGAAIKELTARLERDLGIPNPQIAVVEVEVPELNPFIMASRIAMAIERGVHYRRSIFWAARRIMEEGALGLEILIKGKIRSGRSRYEVVREGFIPKSGQPALEQVKTATIPVKLKQGIQGITVTIVPPDAEFPDKISLEGLPEMVEKEEGELAPPEKGPVGEEERGEGEGVKEGKGDADSEDE